jgi:hypothetical protein
MFDDSRSSITRAFLRSEFDLDFRAHTYEHDAALLKRLRDWDGRLHLSETQAEGAFTQTFFVDTWGYGESGRVAPEEHTIIAKLPIAWWAVWFARRANQQKPVQPPLQKYFCFSEMQIRLYDLPSWPTEGRLEIVTDAGQDAVDADALLTNGVW